MGTKYNYNSFRNGGFDDTIFTAPIDGIYSFYVTTRHYSSRETGFVYLYHNDNKKQIVAAQGSRAESQGAKGNISVQATIVLQKDELVYIGFNGTLTDLSVESTTYFEGRLISKIQL